MSKFSEGDWVVLDTDNGNPTQVYKTGPHGAHTERWGYYDDSRLTLATPMTDNDPVNRPAHYTSYPVEVIELTEHMNFCRGNAVKYIARAGLKDPATEVEDLRKAIWYLRREMRRLGYDE